MALLRFNLPPRPLAGLYSRIVWRELGFPPPFVPQNTNDIRDVVGLFARSLAVALGQSFAAGEFVRHEFAQALHDRLRNYSREYAPNLIFPWVVAIDHAAVLAEIVARRSPDSRLAGIEIPDDTVADAAQTDFRLSQERDIVDWSPNGPLGSLWRGEQPRWWRQWIAAPDSWVSSMNQLGEPLWTSQRLPRESLSYLVNFGLDRIESKPDLIEPWTQRVSTLVAAASKPRADIREVVNCCRIDP